MAPEEMSHEEASNTIDDIVQEISSAVVADRSFLETVLLSIMGRGHVLLEDVPGTGKTLTARSFATAFGLSFSRIQFTPDLLPSDITGTYIYNEQDGSFEFNAGPIFANIVLADEINRAPPKTQAALLEAMGEKQVTVEGETRELPDPFFVIATQNPVEQEGTFPLPEAQVDRFMAKTTLGYPERDGEIDILRRRLDRSARAPTVDTVIDDAEQVLDLQEVPEQTRVNDDRVAYIADVSRATREDHRVSVGVSPRGSQRLLEAVRTRAVIEGRPYATPDDVKTIADSVLAHRIVLTSEAKVNGVDKSTVVADVLDEVPVPTVDRAPETAADRA